MPQLLAFAPNPGLTPAVPLRATPGSLPTTGDFSAALGALLLSGVATKADGERQAPAGDGKDLPGDDDTVDPLLAWMPEGLVPLPVLPPPPPPGLTLSSPVEIPASVIESDIGVPQPLVDEAMPAPVTSDGIAEAAVDTLEPLVATPDTVVPDDVLPASVRATHTAARETINGAVLRATNAPALTAQVLQSSTAGQAFAAAITAAAGDVALPNTANGPIPITVSGMTAEQLRTSVQAMTGVDQAPLDMSRESWTGAMVDRITALRDAAELADTRIRLSPDNLGNVDVSIRRDGDRIHVHFAAENAVTRQMLTDAAPRLSELADARGVKLGQTSVDAGTGGEQGASRHHESRTPDRPVAASRAAVVTGTDDRIA